jgi:hypothetical protein
VRKWARFWSPWPNARELTTLAPILIGCGVTLPVYLLLLRGAWVRRTDRAVWWIALAPLLTTALLHLMFVGSLRYRVAVMPPALVVAAAGLPLRSPRTRAMPDPLV